MPPKTNLKQQAGLAKKAENDAKKQAAADAQRATQEEAAWNEGANLKKQSRAEDTAAKQDEALQRRRERDALLAAEEASGPSTTSTAKKAVQASKASKKKNDLSFLEDALVSAADKKAKQKKAVEAAAKQKAEQEAKLKAEKLAHEKASIDPLFANTEQMIGGTDDDTNADVGREANKARMDLVHTTGIDAALDHMNIGNGSTIAKVTYADFEARMLPVVKSENPGLRLSQYKEKVFNLWKKSPENPAHQVPLP
jgi:Coiled-coil domain-containing protein 124 /Oxs1